MTFRTTDAIAKQRFSSRGVELYTNTISVSEHRIHYAKTGKDDLPTLLFIHGTPGSWDAFSMYMQDSILLSRYRMISVDRPGFGYSNFGKVYNLSRQAQILNEWVKKFDNGKPVYLVGHSLGGPMIIKMTADDPELYKGLVIISGSLDPKEEKPERWRLLYKTPFNFLVPGAFKPSNEELWYLKKDLIDLKKDFAKISIPVYFIHGSKDTWVPPGNVAYGKQLLVNAPQVGEMMLDGGNHFVPWTRYKEIRDVLAQLPQ